MAVWEEQTHMHPVQCRDDQFGREAVVVYGDNSYPLKRCTPFLNTFQRQSVEATYQRNVWAEEETENNDTVPTAEPTHQLQDDEGDDDHGQLNVTPHPVPETGVAPQAFDHDGITTDGGFPAAVAAGGMENYRPWQLDSITLLEEAEKEKDFKENNRNVAENGGKKCCWHGHCVMA